MSFARRVLALRCDETHAVALILEDLESLPAAVATLILCCGESRRRRRRRRRSNSRRRRRRRRRLCRRLADRCEDEEKDCPPK
jgi:hypothetical protein